MVKQFHMDRENCTLGQFIGHLGFLDRVQSDSWTISLALGQLVGKWDYDLDYGHGF